MNKIIFDLSGSFIESDKKIIESFVNKTMDLILNKETQIGIVIGGGKKARDAIGRAKERGILNKYYLDKVGIDATRLNAEELFTYFEKYFNKEEIPPSVPHSIDEAVNEFEDGKPLVIMGGTSPGHTTDKVASLFAEAIESDLLIIGTKTNGIYDKDPNKFQNAKKMLHLKPRDLLKLSYQFSFEPGSSSPVDPGACGIIDRSDMDMIVCHFKDIPKLSIENLGTVVSNDFERVVEKLEFYFK